MSTEDQLPAELRVAPTPEPTVEVDAPAHVPPEAAVVAVTHAEEAAAPAGTPGPSYETLAAAEAAGDQAGPPPAEMRVAPTPGPAVDVGEKSPVPPEAAVERNPTS